MKKLFSVAIVLFSVFSVEAQEFQGLAVYESKTSTSDFKANFGGNREITPDMQKNIEETMRKMMEKTFVLNFDKTASIYKEEEKRCDETKCNLIKKGIELEKTRI